jgi:N-acetylglucosaminyl-diphospho-decaprenol L-rhamnosyltransferase
VQEAIVLSGLAARFPKSRWFGRLDRTWADPTQAAPVDWVPGAFALVRRDLFERLGGFDERFFLYYEEVDLCRRIHAAGYRVQYWPELRVQHIGGVSARTVAGATVARSGSQLTLWRARSGLLYYRKNHGWLTAWAVNRLERGWHRLRAWRAALHGQAQKAAESVAHLGLLRRAWHDTLGGRVAPPRPW